MPLVRPRGEAACEFRGVQQFFQVDSRLVAHALQKIDQVFGREIAARAGAIRTAPKARGGCVKFANTGLESRQRVGQAPSIRVMKMEHDVFSLQIRVTEKAAYCFGDLIRKGHAIGVTDGDAPRAGLPRGADGVDHRLAGDPALKRAMEAGGKTGAKSHAIALREADRKS